MHLTLTPEEFLALLRPPLLTLRGPRQPLDLDKMTATESAGAINALTDDEADDEGLTAQRALVVALADLAQAKEELARTSTLVEEKAEELRQLIENIGKIRNMPVARAQAVIDNAGAQAHDLARIFFLESAGPAWYQGIRATLKNLLDTLGVEVDEKLEVHLEAPAAPLEAPAEEPPVAPYGDGGPGSDVLDTEEEMIRTLASDEPRPTLAFGGRRSTLGADSVDAVPPAGQMRTKCKTCGDELRFYPEGWIDAETRATGEDGHAHEPDLSDVRCEHGLAADMHCCECRRSGFFTPDSCNCYTTGVDVGAGDVEVEAEIKDEIEF